MRDIIKETRTLLQKNAIESMEDMISSVEALIVLNGARKISTEEEEALVALETVVEKILFPILSEACTLQAAETIGNKIENIRKIIEIRNSNHNSNHVDKDEE